MNGNSVTKVQKIFEATSGYFEHRDVENCTGVFKTYTFLQGYF